MKLVLVIIRDEDALGLLDKLIDEGFEVTKISSSGGFLKQGNTTLLLGIDEGRYEEAIEIIRRNVKDKEPALQVNNASKSGINSKKPGKFTYGGATIFALDVERFERF